MLPTLENGGVARGNVARVPECIHPTLIAERRQDKLHFQTKRDTNLVVFLPVRKVSADAGKVLTILVDEVAEVPSDPVERRVDLVGFCADGSDVVFEFFDHARVSQQSQSVVDKFVGFLEDSTVDVVPPAIQGVLGIHRSLCLNCGHDDELKSVVKGRYFLWSFLWSVYIEMLAAQSTTPVAPSTYRSGIFVRQRKS